MRAFYDNQKGAATAMSVIGFAILCVCAGAYMMVTMRKEEQ
jgi:multiple sugar transport system permease protein